MRLNRTIIRRVKTIDKDDDTIVEEISLRIAKKFKCIELCLEEAIESK